MMFYSIDNIKELGLDQLSEQELQAAHDALNSFAAIFGKDWVDSFFGGGFSPRFVRQITATWSDWQELSSLPGSEEIKQKWSHGFYDNGVLTEIRLAAHLKRKGAKIELSPPVGTKIADLRFECGSGWTYVEISKRALSDNLKAAQAAAGRLAKAAAEAVPGKHGKVGIKRLLDKTEEQEIITWLSGVGDREAQFDGTALFHTSALEVGGGDPTDPSVAFVEEPRMYCTHFSNTAYLLKGTCAFHIDDEAAQEILEREAKQLPKDEGGVIALEIGSVIRGLTTWEPLIRRRFQPTINTRISAVLLFETSLDEHGLRTQGKLLLNPHCVRGLQVSDQELLRSFIEVST